MSEATALLITDIGNMEVNFQAQVKSDLPPGKE